ncbi:MAG: single-stranded DNA-binding protein [Anaerolineae bacterium]|nr:single-stranded DNA-binding protein [Anaerolineae bacterium]
MSTYHQTIVVGNVGRDAQLKYLQSGTAVSDFSIAVTETWNDQATNERREKTTWYRVNLWGRTAETLSQYILKGRQVMVIGTVEARAYMDKNNQPAASLELRARDVRLLGSRGEGGGEGGQYGDYAAPPDNMNDIPF